MSFGGAGMQQVLNLTFPFFALVLCGYAAARCRLLPLDAIPGLNVFVLFFALPCMLFRFAANTPIERLLDTSAFLTYLVCALAMVAITIVATRWRKIGWNDASFGALVVAFPNTGFMGMPLLASLLGGRGLAPAVVSLAVDMVVTTSLCIGLSRLNAAGDSKDPAVARKVLKGVLVNPLPWAILLGGLSSYADVSLYGPLARMVEMMANAGSPAALFTIGAVLARSQLHTAAGGKSAGSRDVPRMVLFKLVLHPCLVLLVGKLAMFVGLPLSASALTVLALVAALPSASSIPMLSERYGADTGRVAQVVLVTTAFAFISFSASVAFLLGEMPKV